MAYMLSKKDVEVQVQEMDSADDTSVKSDTLQEMKVNLEAGWDAPENMENPRNWSTLKKACHVIPVSLLCLSVTAGSSLITPGISAIGHRFNVSETASILSLSLFVLGLAFGPMLAAPISETRGRALVYKFSFPLYMLFTLGAGYSKTFAGLLVCRFLGAAFGAPCLAVAGGTVADLFEVRKMAAGGTVVVLAPFLGPCLGPVIGGFSASYTEYQWTQWDTLILALGSYITILPTQETHRKVLLKAKAKRLNCGPLEPELSTRDGLKILFSVTLLIPLRMLISEPIVALLSLYNAFNFSVMFAFFIAFPLVFVGQYGFEIWQYGLTFLGIGLGVLLAAVASLLVDQFIYQPISRKGGDRIKKKGPEQRLYIGMIGAFFLPIGLIWFALTAKSSVHWIVPVLATVPFAFGNYSIFSSGTMYMLDVYGQTTGASAMAANGLLRYAMGAVFPLFTLQMYTGLGIKWATLVLAFICLLMLPIPWAFYVYGPSIRRKSAYTS